VIATPQFHHWHHAPTRQPMAAQFGIDDSEPVGYLRQLVWPLRSAA
jgi:hypothetical protein